MLHVYHFACIHGCIFKGRYVFGELYVLQAYKIAAWTVICEVWSGNVVVILSRRAFGIMVFGHVWLHPFHCAFHFMFCWCFVNFVAGAILAERFLSLDLTRDMTFSGAIALLLGVFTLECFDVFVGVPLFLAGAIVTLRFESHHAM